MIDNNLITIQEQLDRIESKLNGTITRKFLSINQVCELTSLSASTIRRAINKGQLKCSKKLGKIIVKESDMLNWIQQ